MTEYLRVKLILEFRLGNLYETTPHRYSLGGSSPLHVLTCAALLGLDSRCLIAFVRQHYLCPKSPHRAVPHCDSRIVAFVSLLQPRGLVGLARAESDLTDFAMRLESHSWQRSSVASEIQGPVRRITTYRFVSERSSKVKRSRPQKLHNNDLKKSCESSSMGIQKV
jgi:hypothetical protein